MNEWFTFESDTPQKDDAYCARDIHVPYFGSIMNLTGVGRITFQSKEGRLNDFVAISDGPLYRIKMLRLGSVARCNAVSIAAFGALF